MKTLETKRLILRKPKKTDLTDFYEFSKLLDVGPSAGWMPHESINESREVLLDHIKRGDVWFIILKDSNKMIGTINLDVYDFYQALEGIAEIGYALNSNYWHNGYASEAVSILIDHAFNGLKVNKLIAGHTLENVYSKKILEKNNFKFTTIDYSRSYENKDIDSVYMYELRKEDYYENKI